MTASNIDKARRESAIEKIRREWYQDRIAQIHRQVSVYDILRRYGVKLHQSSDVKAEQFPCPFHGKDEKPSSRVHPESASGPSHAWCFVCQERWDVIALTMKYEGIKFGQALAFLEKCWGIETPPMPDNLRESGPAIEPALEEFRALYDVCDTRLRMARPSYRHLKDLQGFSTASFLLDKVHHQIESKQMTPLKGIDVLQQLLQKIGDKVRSSEV